MIRSWRVGQFKSVGAATELKLAPLTVITGANSSGKSTLIHSMLLVTQSASRFALSALSLNGNRILLGTFRDVSHRFAGRPIEVSVSFDADFSERSSAEPFSALRFFRHYWRSPEVRGPLVGRLDLTLRPDPAGDLDATALRIDRLEFTATPRAEPPQQLLITRRLGGRPPAVNLPSSTSPTLLLGNHDYTLRLEGIPTEEGLLPGQFSENVVAGVELQGPVPSSLRLAYDPVARSVASTLESLLSNSTQVMRYYLRRLEQGSPDQTTQFVLGFFAQPEVRDAFAPPPKTIGEINSALRRVKLSKRREFAVYVRQYVEDVVRPRQGRQIAFEHVPLPEWLMYSAQSLTQTLAAVRHIGPLREAPRALYELGDSGDPRDVGSRGQFTAAVLDRFGSAEVVSGPERKETLRSAVDRWMKELGVHSGVLSEELGGLGHRIQIRDEALRRGLDLTQVGVGVSQILPILVQSLLTVAGGTILIEQPELHLNPGVQSKFADFLVDMSRSGRQVICETHSEYIVNKLRILSAEERITTDDFRVYFVRRVSGASSIEEVRFGESGRVLNWPTGFFDQSAADSARLLELDLGG